MPDTRECEMPALADLRIAGPRPADRVTLLLDRSLSVDGEGLKKGDEIKVYIWNNQGSDFLLDDIKVRFLSF